MGARVTIKGLKPYLNAWKKDLTKDYIKAQGESLVSYARNKIIDIADAIKATGYDMEDNGNLLDSLCWVVSFDGKKVGSGYYRKGTATEITYLHALFPEEVRKLYPVNGHALASMFIREHAKKSEKGQWRVYFAILAPYWGYWELGHHNVLTHRYEKFAIMVETRDDVSRDLNPAVVDFHSSYPTYSASGKGSFFGRMRKKVQRTTWKWKYNFDHWTSRR